MVWTIVQLAISLVAILGAAVLFTNAVEILGERLHLGVGQPAACSRRWGPLCRRP